MGIYLLLGMEKRQVSKILLIETLLIGVLALIAGLVSGVFLSQGLAMLTAKMFAVQMKEFKFVFSQMAFIQTILYFAIIFIIVMIFNGITKSYIVGHSVFDIHWDSWNSISFNSKKPDACCGQ